MLDNLTILITTYKRYSYLKRLLQFYDSYNLQSKLIILGCGTSYNAGMIAAEMFRNICDFTTIRGPIRVYI